MSVNESVFSTTESLINVSEVYREAASNVATIYSEKAEYLLRKYSYPVICILGVLGNTMSAFVFLSPTLRKYSCSVFLAARSISDNGVLLSLFMAWLDFVQIRIFHVQVICQLTVFLTYICCYLSVWCVVCVTIDNYIRMCHLSVVKLYCKSKHAIIILSVLVFVSLCIYHIPLWTTRVMTYAGTDYCMTTEEYYRYQYTLTYIDTALTFVIPLAAILVCLSLLICKAIRAHHRTSSNRERFNQRSWPSSTNHYLKVTKLLFAVSVIFLILHTPTHVIKLNLVIETFSGNIQQHRLLKTLDHIFQVMYALNFAVNFLVYYIFGNNFRHVHAFLFCRVDKWQKKLCDRKYCDKVSTLTDVVIEAESML